MVDIIPIDGSWINERGSMLEIVCQGDALSGYYRTNVGRPDPRAEYALIGRRNGDLLGFVVAWAGFDSLTSWAGRYQAADDTIVTLWHMITARHKGYDQDGHELIKEVPLWEAFKTQQSTFRRYNSAKPSN